MRGHALLLSPYPYHIFRQTPKGLGFYSSGAKGWTGGRTRPPPISHRDQFSNSSKSDEKEWGGGGMVGFNNVSRSNKYTCRVTKNCAFKLLYDLEN